MQKYIIHHIDSEGMRDGESYVVEGRSNSEVCRINLKELSEHGWTEDEVETEVIEDEGSSYAMDDRNWNGW